MLTLLQVLYFLWTLSNFPIAQYVWCMIFFITILLKRIKVALTAVIWFEGNWFDTFIVELCYNVVLLIHVVVVTRVDFGAYVDYT